MNSPGARAVTWATIMVKQRIGRDIERHAEKNVGAPLVHLARQAARRHIELKQQMARRQGHRRHIGHVPAR